MRNPILATGAVLKKCRSFEEVPHWKDTDLSSPELYDKISAASIARIQSGQIEIDPFSSRREADTRRGISLIIPVQGIAEPHQRLVETFAELEPEQYYYPLEDLHFTVFDFIQARTHYEHDERLVNAFLSISQEAAQAAEVFEIELRGIVFSPAAGIIKGYDSNRLVSLRDHIRRLMLAQGLQNDERYASESAHVTFMRFQSRLAYPALLVEAIAKHSEMEIGQLQVSRMELVEHDWYNSCGTKRIIGQVFTS